MSNHHRFPHRSPEPFRSLTGERYEEAEEATETTGFASLNLSSGGASNWPYADEEPGENFGMTISEFGPTAHYSPSKVGQAKPFQPGALQQEAKGLNRHHIQTPRRKLKALESLSLVIAWKRDKPPLKGQAVDIKDVKHSCVLQFAFSSKKTKEFLMYRIQKKGINISFDEMKSGRINLDVTRRNCKTEKDVQACITEAFSNISLEDIDYLKIYKASKNFELLEKTKSAKLDSLMESEELMLFDGTEAVYLVGDHKDLELIEEELQLQKQDKRCLKDVRPWSLLKNLKIEQNLIAQRLKIAFEIHGEVPTILGTVDDVDKAEKMIRDFSREVIRRKVKFQSEEYKVLLSINGEKMNDYVLGHFQKVLQNKKIISCLEIDEIDGDYCVFVTSKGEKNTEKAEKAVADALNSLDLTVDKFKEIEGIVYLWKKKNKLKIVKHGEKIVHLICTSDVFDEILEELDTREDVPLPQVIGKFMETHGRENLEKLSKRHNLNWNIENSILKLQGSKENIAKFKDEYQKEYVADVSQIKVSPSFIHEHEEMLEGIANDNKCCFQSKYRNEEKDPLLQKCKSIVTWNHVYNPEKITLISGEIEDVQADFRILFVTDHQFPLNDFGENSGMKEDLAKCTVENGENTLGLGRILDIRELSKYGKCETRAIVLSKSNPYSSKDRLSVSKIEIAVMKVLNEALGKRVGSVVVPVCLLDSKMQPATIAKACVNAMMSVSDPATPLHMYLLCDKKSNQTEIAQMIDDIYQGMGKGYYRDLHSDDIKLKQGFHKITWSVKEASLLDMETDVIVNTVQCNLDLNVGKMSQQILLKAEDEVQEECNSKYPNGIQRGQLAVTSAGKLKAKQIFHCALPSFYKHKYTDNIKSMVRLCLLEMEIRNLKTIAFPAFGTGKLGYPIRETAKAMLEAIEEYQYCSIKSGVKKAVIVMLKGDNHTYKVFSQAEEKQKSNGRNVTGKEVFSGLNTSVGFSDFRVQLNVARSSDLGQLSSTVVDVEFVKIKDGEELVELKYSSEEPTTPRDVLKVNLDKTSDVRALTAAVQSLLKYCKDYRISEILIPVLGKGVACSALEQIKVIKRVVQDDAKTEKTRRLSKVYIVVPEAENLEYFEKTLNSEEQSLVATVKSWFSEKIIWRRNACENYLVEIRIVGNKDDSVKKTLSQITECVYRLSKQSQEKNSIEMTDMSNIKPVNEVADKEQNVDAEGDQVELVSAELNPGIIRYLVHGECFDQWKLKIEAAFHLGFQNKENDIVVVEGNFGDLCSFEKYLDDTFPNDPETFKGMKDVDYQADKLNTAAGGPLPHVEGGCPEKKDKTDQKKPEGSKNSAKSVNTNSDVTVTPGFVGHEGQSQKGNVDIKFDFELEGLKVCLIQGDLSKQIVDCIVCSVNESLIAVGLAEKIANAAGIEFGSACSTEIEQNGKLKVGDCRLVMPGNLQCKNVMHVMGPSWSIGKANQLDLLKSMEDVVQSCLTLADNSRFSSVALPLISTGASNFPLPLLAQQYMRALKVFSQKRKHVSVIYIVEKDSPKLGKVVMELKQQIKQMKVLPNPNVVKESTIPISSTCSIFSTSGTVNINMVVGQMESVQIDAIVSPEDRSFSGRSRIAKALINHGSQAYRSKHGNLLKDGKAADMKVGSVLPSSSYGGQLLCKFVLHTYVPRHNKGYLKIAKGLETDIRGTISNVLAKATELKCTSVAVPLLGVSEEENISTPVETCCQAMINGITGFLSHQKTTLSRIEFICVEPTVVKYFREEMEKRVEVETMC